MAEIEFAERSGVGLVTLNRPKTLHALTQDMIVAFDQRLRAWARDAAIRAVVVQGEGPRAFCAGGDIVAVWRAGMEARSGEGDGATTRSFFQLEYNLDRRIRRFPKPYIALIDGITMGGGVGISAYGSHVVATERTLWAMPETVIGFFPDVGTTWLLSHLPGHAGVWLGLTGARLRAGDLLELGLARFHLPSEVLPAFLDELSGLPWDTEDPRALVDAALARHAVAPDTAETPTEVAQQRDAIARCFGQASVEEIRAALSAEGTDWADRQLQSLDQASPTSLKVTLRALRLGADQDFDTCLRREYGLTQAVCARVDFYEGVRAMLVDKDRAPRWQPARLADVSEAEVAAHFAPPDGEHLRFDEAW